MKNVNYCICLLEFYMFSKLKTIDQVVSLNRQIFIAVAVHKIEHTLQFKV